MIEVNQVHFRYHTTDVLHDFSLIEHEKVIVGLWGRNGSGKTTLMKLLAGHLKPNQGEINIQGFTPYNDDRTNNHLCYMQEDHPFSKMWKVKDALRFGNYYNPNFDMDFAKKLLSIFNLNEKKHVSGLSKGMKSALQFIIGMASNADITILDEPTNGLDIAMQKKFNKVLLDSYEENPRLILLSSHNIEEIQTLCEALVVIHDGNVLFHEPMETMREKGIWLSGEKDAFSTIIQSHTVLEQQVIGTKMKVMLDEPFTSEWKHFAMANGLTIEPASLHDYLVNRTEKRIEVAQ
ncbi:ABC transporter ATP-binding protein [Sporosarcina thermotolerans]|uniref:ABC transporter ATP-binding protein n=1 Tax=Sporosarcina thermotolerans TaxID=633404 RepID=A0AAW9A8J4_9BACL|nr:ABC transporter ATP-binding protein [Sporosarcina thermotolerans]MDW0117517.1 ABC transporter ATP-binding protein [Sporosarcina thermotolerans]WHT49682.1 ABC transporter ATP-binding protein [Sporosarcina thermotolerans]